MEDMPDIKSAETASSILLVVSLRQLLCKTSCEEFSVHHREEGDTLVLYVRLVRGWTLSSTVSDWERRYNQVRNAVTLLLKVAATWALSHAVLRHFNNQCDKSPCKYPLSWLAT